MVLVLVNDNKPDADCNKFHLFKATIHPKMQIQIDGSHWLP